jgi:lipopolysaccharide transport system permease protein
MTYLEKSYITISRYEQGLRRHSVSGTVRWSLYCLLVVLFCYCFIQPMMLFADSPLVTQEIRYHMPEAGEMLLVWGINGWTVVPEELRPAGTAVKNAVMHTPMVRKGDTFVARVQVPSGTTIDYGFLITRMRSGAAVHIWEADGKQDYHTIATQDGVVEVRTKSMLTQDHTPAIALGIGLPLLIGLGTVFAIRTVLITRRDSATVKAPLYTRRFIYLRDLLRELVVRDMKLRYKRSILGIVWSLLNPLIQMLVFIFVFRNVLPLDIPNYPSFVFTGVLAWSWFQAALFLATGAITDNRGLIRRPGFPTAILPVVTVTTNLIHFLLALPVSLLFLVLGGGRLTSAILTLPLVIMLQFLLILGLGYLVATIHVTFRDTQHLLGVFLMLLFYLTPVFYDASIIPERYQTLYRLNPMFHLIAAYRTVLIDGSLPDLPSLLAVGVAAGVLLWLGHTVFTRASYRFVEEL